MNIHTCRSCSPLALSKAALAGEAAANSSQQYGQSPQEVTKTAAVAASDPQTALILSVQRDRLKSSSPSCFLLHDARVS